MIGDTLKAAPSPACGSFEGSVETRSLKRRCNNPYAWGREIRVTAAAQPVFSASSPLSHVESLQRNQHHEEVAGRNSLSLACFYNVYLRVLGCGGTQQVNTPSGQQLNVWQQLDLSTAQDSFLSEFIKKIIEIDPTSIPPLIITLSELHGEGFDTRRLFLILAPLLDNTLIYEGFRNFEKVSAKLNCYNRAIESKKSPEGTIFFEAVARLLNRWSHFVEARFGLFYDRLKDEGGISQADKHYLLDEAKRLLEGCQELRLTEASERFLKNLVLTLDKMLYWHRMKHIQDPSLVSLILRLFERFCKEKLHARLSGPSYVKFMDILGYTAAFQAKEILDLTSQALVDLADHLEQQKNPLNIYFPYIPNLIISMKRLHNRGFDMRRFFSLYTPIINAAMPYKEILGFDMVQGSLRSFIKPQNSQTTSQEATVFVEAVERLLERWRQNRPLRRR